ncbi:MAG: class I SAM-dependent methyltransferase, partial [Chrysiogenales bacterium]
MPVDYSVISQSYDDYRSYSDEVLHRISRTAGITRNMTVLDVGGGTGNLALGLRDISGSYVICMDLALSMLKNARDKNLPVVCTDANRQLPFHNDSFDAITAAYVIHHVPGLKGLFLECFRVIKNGTLALLTSSHEQIENVHPVMKEFFPICEGIDKKRFPEIGEIIELLRHAGFDRVRCEDILIEQSPVDEAYLERVKKKFVSTYYL